MVVTTNYAKTALWLKDILIAKLEEKIDSIVPYDSLAKNTATEESDIDILVILGDNERSLYNKISRIRTRIDLEDNGLTTSVQLTREEIERCIKLGSPFIRSIADEGVILYERGIFQKLGDSVLAKS